MDKSTNILDGLTFSLQEQCIRYWNLGKSRNGIYLSVGDELRGYIIHSTNEMSDSKRQKDYYIPLLKKIKKDALKDLEQFMVKNGYVFATSRRHSGFLDPIPKSIKPRWKLHSQPDLGTFHKTQMGGLSTAHYSLVVGSKKVAVGKQSVGSKLISPVNPDSLLINIVAKGKSLEIYKEQDAFESNGLLIINVTTQISNNLQHFEDNILKLNKLFENQQLLEEKLERLKST